jgi:ATP-dependent DNA helicase RecG
MCTTYDGYKIAEADLALRGPGDFLRDAGSEALRQSGGIKFKIADMCEDSELMQKAFESAKKIIELSPSLEDFPLLKSKVNSVFNSDRSSIS